MHCTKAEAERLSGAKGYIPIGQWRLSCDWLEQAAEIERLKDELLTLREKVKAVLDDGADRGCYDDMEESLDQLRIAAKFQADPTDDHAEGSK